MSQPPCISFIAPSGTGKTTLLTGLIANLSHQRGLSIGAVKKSHHDFEIDYPGKDSHQLRMAGAASMVIASPYRQAIIHELSARKEPELEQQLAVFADRKIDLVVVEGFREAAIPKIELFRSSVSDAPLFLDDPQLLALATDSPARFLRAGVNLLDINNVENIASFVCKHFHLQSLNRG